MFNSTPIFVDMNKGPLSELSIPTCEKDGALDFFFELRVYEPLQMTPTVSTLV